jgi:hypothetical protein
METIYVITQKGKENITPEYRKNLESVFEYFYDKISEIKSGHYTSETKELEKRISVKYKDFYQFTVSFTGWKTSNEWEFETETKEYTVTQEDVK